jgi:hypothetical protein
MKKEILRQMSDEQLVKTIEAVKLTGDKIAATLVLKEASRRTDTKNKELLEFQDFIVDRVLNSFDKNNK